MTKRSVIISGHYTSVSLEDAFYEALQEMAASEGRSLNDLVTKIDADRDTDNLSSAIRIAVLNHYRNKAIGDAR